MDGNVRSVIVGLEAMGDAIMPKGVTMLRKVEADKSKRVSGRSDGYVPSEGEEFMNAKQLDYFKKKLLDWKDDILKDNRETLQYLHEDSNQHSDNADRASAETDKTLELRARDRQRKLICKIEKAIERINDGSYGYCMETGEPIGLKRLDARPIATLSIEAQERHERKERIFRT
jgi:DnaK suppressor protein